MRSTKYGVFFYKGGNLKQVKNKRKLLLIILLLLIPVIYSLMTKNPEGTNISGNPELTEAEFIYDLSYVKEGKKIHEQNIFNREMETIKNAEEFLVVDFFLFNDEYNKELKFPNQVEAMTDLLIEKKKARPSMPILFVTDPINNFYGAYEEDNIKRLRDAGVQVVVTDLNQMRDSNPLFSGFYRAYLKWFGTGGRGWIRNFFARDGEKVTVRSILKLANFKGNHRKVVISEKEAVVASANPHDPSSYHSNVAMIFRGKPMEDLIRSESIFFDEIPETIKNFRCNVEDSPYRLKVITEEKIHNALSENIRKSKKGDKIRVGIFYISEFEILKELGEAAKRGVDVRIIADLNKDAFGIEKNGSPNRPALSELKDEMPEIQIRWYNTHGEQFHTKMIYFDFQDRAPYAILGSANYTRRNLNNYNLETNVAVEMERNSPMHEEIDRYFNRLWNNEDGEYTLPFAAYNEDGFIMRRLWKLQEVTGICTW